MASHVLGIDVSTTATKALLLDDSGAVAGVRSAEYDYDIPRPLWSEQNPADWWTGAVSAIRSVLDSTDVRADEIEAIGLTGQMHGAVVLDASDAVLRPAILWNDQRTAAECDLIREAVGAQRLIEITGNDALTGFTAPKLVWVREHEPEVWSRIAHLLLPKDYVRLQLTGERAVDKADAAGTLLLDLAARDWSAVVLEALDIPATWLPRTFEGPEVTGRLTDAAAAATGLRAGTPVVAGGGDQSANAVGVGAVAPGTTALSLGTSGVIFASTDRPLFDPGGRVHAFCHAVPGRWHMMSVMLSAGGSLRWFRDALAPGMGYDELLSGVGRRAGRQRRPLVPPLPLRRTQPAHRPACSRRVRGPDPGSRSAPSGARGAGGSGLRAARRPGPDAWRRHAGALSDPHLGRRDRQPAVAPDPRRRAGYRARHREHHRGRRLRGGRARSCGVWLVRQRGRGDLAVNNGHDRGDTRH